MKKTAILAFSPIPWELRENPSSLCVTMPPQSPRVCPRGVRVCPSPQRHRAVPWEQGLLLGWVRAPPGPRDPARAAAPPGPVHTTRAAGMRNKLYYQVSQNLRKPQPGGGRLVPGGGRAQESQARAKPSILPLQQEALAALRPGRAVSCPMGDAWGHRGGCCTSQHTAALLGLLKHAKMDFAHPSQDCCSPC